MSKAQYGRVKGAEWFPLLYKKDIMVLGQGGIGSWVTLLLSRIGCKLHTYDMDLYEEHNMTGQLVGKSSVGKNKAEAMKSIIAEFSPDAEVDCYGEYAPDSMTNDIVICGFDNMAARKLAFSNWKQMLARMPDVHAKNCFFQDGRLLAEQLQIFNIPGDRQDLIEEYQKNHLPDDSEVPDADCTFKQTSHFAAMIASHMVEFLTNWANHSLGEAEIIKVPFKFEHIGPLNFTKNDYA